MIKYIVRRTVASIFTLWILATLTFFLMNLIPGDPFSDEKRLPPRIIENMKRYYGLDRPLPVQYGLYMKRLAKLDLGYSIRYSSRKVNSIIKDAFPYSAQLGVQSLLYGIILGLSLGIFAAVKHNRVEDRLAMAIAVFGVSVPGFILAALLQYLFGVKLRIFPVALFDSMIHTVLPTIALGTRILASQARLMRTSMLDVLNQDYIRTAVAKGVPYPIVVWRHAVGNAILPIVTILGPLTAILLTGTFVVENIFAIPGLGRFFVQGIQTLDYPVILGTTLFYGAFLVFLNLAVDIAYGFIDPRIRVGD